MLTTRFLFPKFFPKKFGQKIGAGPPMEDFGNGTCAGSGPAPPRPPFVQMKNTRGSFSSLRWHFGRVPAVRAKSFGYSVRNSRISVCRSFAYISRHIHSRAG